MFRGSTYKPTSSSTRILSTCWWMFLLTTGTIYFLLLVGHLTSNNVSRYSSLSEILDNVDQVGVVKAGSTWQMLQKSVHPLHQSLVTRLSLVDDYLAGLSLISETDEPVAMLMEETAAEYIAAQHCDKYTVGHLEDRYYAFAFRKGNYKQAHIKECSWEQFQAPS